MTQRTRESGWLIVGPHGPFEEVDASLLGRPSLTYPLPRGDEAPVRRRISDTPPMQYVRSPIRVDGERVWIYAPDGASSLDLFDAIEHVRRLVRLTASARIASDPVRATDASPRQNK